MINHDSELQGLCIISEDIQNGSNYSATLKEYRRMKRLKRGPMSVNGLKNIISKFEET